MGPNFPLGILKSAYYSLVYVRKIGKGRNIDRLFLRQGILNIGIIDISGGVVAEVRAVVTTGCQAASQASAH